MNLYNKLIIAKTGDSDHIEAFINLFSNIINKYSHKLNGDDTKQDLNILLIHIINRIPINKISFYEDKAILAYISKAIKNEYIRLSKKNSKITSNEIYINEDVNLLYENQSYDIDVIDIIKDLTLKEQTIIRMIFIEGFTVSDVSTHMKISRQAVNQSKNRAIKKLKYYIL